MLCPVNWTKGVNVVIKDKDGNFINFLKPYDSVTISGYVIYKTAIWDYSTEVTFISENIYDLSGDWEGYMGERYYDHWGYENYSEYYTVMRFYRNGGSYNYGATAGEGEQIDYVDGNRYRTYHRTFTWEVNQKIIYIYYDNGEKICITNFAINGRYFDGRMKYVNRYGEVISEANFSFRKTTDFNWDLYYRW